LAPAPLEDDPDRLLPNSTVSAFRSARSAFSVSDARPRDLVDPAGFVVGRHPGGTGLGAPPRGGTGRSLTRHDDCETSTAARRVAARVDTGLAVTLVRPTNSVGELAGPRLATLALGDTDPDAPEADPDAPDADPDAPDADPDAPEADPDAPEADPDAPEADPEPADAAAPPAAVDPPPAEPSTASTAVIRCDPGRNTICPSVTVPVCASPNDACQASTAAVVAASKVWLIVIWCCGSKPSATRFCLSSWTSTPSPTPADKLR